MFETLLAAAHENQEILYFRKGIYSVSALDVQRMQNKSFE